MLGQGAPEAQPIQVDPAYVVAVQKERITILDDRLILLEAYLQQLTDQLRLWQTRYEELDNLHSACAAPSDAVLIEPDTGS